MTDDERAELERLRARVASLEAGQTDEQRVRLDSALRGHAASAQRANQNFARLQAGQDIDTTVSENEREAAYLILSDMGVI